jgi:hypothetical protein
MPDVAGLVPGRVQDDAPDRHCGIEVIEKIEAHTRSMPAEYRKIDAVCPWVSAKWEGYAGTYGLDLAQAEQMFQCSQLPGALWRLGLARHCR